MGVSTDVVARACERVFVRVCDVGRAVPADTPAAAFLAAAARHVDEAQARLSGLSGLSGPEGLADVLAPLRKAGSLLGDVGQMSQDEVEGLDSVSVIVDGICVTLQIDQREAARASSDDLQDPSAI
jgi:hypothetical protein